jgi:hypothetical protein
MEWPNQKGLILIIQMPHVLNDLIPTVMTPSYTEIEIAWGTSIVSMPKFFCEVA